MPDEVPFELVNKLMTKKAIEELIDTTFRISGGKSTVLLADRLRTLGFQHSTTSGISASIADMIIPDEKNVLIQKAESEVGNVKDQYLQGKESEAHKQDIKENKSVVVSALNFHTMADTNTEFDFTSFVKSVSRKNTAVPKYIRDNWTIVLSIRNQLENSE